MSELVGPCSPSVRRPTPTLGLRPAGSALILATLLAACGPAPEDAPPATQALLDAWGTVEIENPHPTPEVPPKAELRFDGSGVAATWEAVQGIEDLRVEDGRLVGRTTSENPVLLLQTEDPLGSDDELWSAALTVRADKGSRTALHPVRSSGPPLPAVVDRQDEWPLTSPLLPGEELHTYTKELDKVFLFEMPMATTEVRRILVRPSDEAGADFALESVRLVFRGEHLASLASGPGWQGLSEVFREALVARAPETLAFRLTLPERPWLDLAVGTVAEPTPTFQVTVTPKGEEEATVVAELEAEKVDRWSAHRLDLGPWAGQAVTLRLAAEAEEPGALALWGHPTVRSSRPPTAEDEEPPQTVVVFLTDTLRRDHLDAWGYGRETAPTLTRLAGEGTRFADTIAQATWTKASVPSILTSLYPLTAGIRGLNDRIPAAETTLAEAYRAAGYATFATSSVPFSGQLTNLHQGVEVMYEIGALRHLQEELPGVYQSKTAAAWMGVYLDWLERHRDVPTFAFFHAMDPHSPFQPHAPYDELWTEAGDAERFETQADQVRPHIESPLLKRFMAPSREELAKAGVDEESFVAHEKNWYDGSIRGVDDQLARLVETLDELGLTDRTLLAFCSDHGEEFLEHGNHWHGMTTYGEVANVPLVLWGRGVPQGQVVEATVQNLDLAPTLLELSGLPIPERAQGRSLRPFLEGADTRPRPAFTGNPGDPRDPDSRDEFSLVEDGWKLVWFHNPETEESEYQLFDHETDPLNLEELAGEHPEVVERLAPRLKQWLTHVQAARLDPDEATAEMSAEDPERLRSLGYVE